MGLAPIGYTEVFIEEHWKRKQFQEDLAFFPMQRETAGVVVDLNSFFRNSAGTLKAFTSIPRIIAAFIKVSSVLGGLLGVPSGLSLVRDSFIKGKAAYEHQDNKELVHNVLWALCGSFYAGLSVILAANGALELARIAVPSIFTPLLGALGVGMSAAILGYSGFGLYETTLFRNTMKKVQNSKGERGILDFLNRQISLTPQEMEGKSDAQLARDLQKKWNALERKVGVTCANHIRETLPGLLHQFDSAKAKNLILEVEEANYKERVTHIVLFAIGIISLVASLAPFFTTGPLMPILFGVGALLWLTIDSSQFHKFIGEKCWACYLMLKVYNKMTDSKETVPEIQECQTPIAS